MELKDLEHAVEIGAEAAEVRGGSMFGRGGLRFDLDLTDIAVGNVQTTQAAANVNTLSFGSQYANTDIRSRGNVDSAIHAGGRNIYAPSVSLDNVNDFDVTNSVQVTDPAAVRNAVHELFATTFPGRPFDKIWLAFHDFERLFNGRYPGYCLA